MKKKKLVGIFSVDKFGNGRIEIIPNPKDEDILPIKDGDEVNIVFE